MKLWVRSEGGGKLVFVDNLDVVKINNKKFELSSDSQGSVWVLATYDSEKKALAQLDDIQEFIKTGVAEEEIGVGGRIRVESINVYDLRKKKIE